MKKIIITISPEGKISVEADGYQGSSCEEATAFLKSLGKVSGETKKTEYYDTPLLQEGVRNK